MTKRKIEHITLEEVGAEVDRIRSNSDDYEAAHGMEDTLYARVLAAVAAGKPHASKMAAKALETQEIDMPRYTA